MKRNGWLALAAFLAGILLANLSGKELLTTCGILNTYFLEQYAYSVIHYDGLFCHIFVERLKAVIILFMLGKMVKGRVFVIMLECFIAGTFGFLLVVAIANLGLKGIVITLCGLFPQWIFYLAALAMYASFRLNQDGLAGYKSSLEVKTVSVHAGIYLLFAILIILGIVLESYINPLILKKILKFF